MNKRLLQLLVISAFMGTQIEAKYHFSDNATNDTYIYNCADTKKAIYVKGKGIGTIRHQIRYLTGYPVDPGLYSVSFDDDGKNYPIEI